MATTKLDVYIQFSSEEEIVAYTVDGTPLTRKSYIAAVKKSEEEMNQGDFITHEQLRENSKKS